MKTDTKSATAYCQPTVADRVAYGENAFKRQVFPLARNLL